MTSESNKQMPHHGKLYVYVILTKLVVFWFFFLIFKFFFILGCAESLLLRRLFFSCAVWASLVEEHRLQLCRLQCCGVQAQVPHGMSDPPTWDQALNPCLLHWQVDSLPLSQEGSPQSQFLFHWCQQAMDCKKKQVRLGHINHLDCYQKRDRKRGGQERRGIYNSRIGF